MQKSMAVTEFGKDLEVLETPLPVPGGNEVLIKTTYGGLCHSDLHQIDAYFDIGGGQKLDMRPRKKRPYVVGHEIEGQVIAVGPDAKGKVNVGQTYAIYPWGGCGGCNDCKVGMENLCEIPHERDLGNGKNMMGGYASHVLVPHHQFCFDKEGIPDGLAATYMCAGLTAYGAIKKIGSPPNGASDVLILGLGGVGMQGFEMAKAVYGAPPLVADIKDAPLAHCGETGAMNFRSDDPASIKLIRQASAMGTGIYAVIDFVGTPESFKFSQSILRRGGRTVQVGLLGGAMSYPLPMFPIRAFSVMGSLVGTLPECREMMELIKAGKVAPIPYEIRSILDANQAIDDMRNGRLSGRCIFKHDWPESKV
jgi:D-arabinose 1-dehydrogenase-like Zn-dependent alcohol dehydrogenase